MSTFLSAAWARLGAARLAWLVLVLAATGALGPSVASAAPITAGSDHFCAITESRELACWGSNAYGQLGTGDTVDHLRPTLVPGLTDVRSVAASGVTTCAATGDGTLRCWGLYSPSSSPEIAVQSRPTVASISGVVDVAISIGDQVCALLRDRTVTCHPSSGNGPAGWTAKAGVTKVVELTPLCARRAGGQVLCWDSFGGAATEVRALRGARSISLTSDNLCGVFSRGKVRCSGEVPVFTGTGSKNDRKVRRVPGITDATGLGTGTQTCVVRGGPVTCTNLLRAVDTERAPAGGPRVIAGIHDVRVVATTFDTACALRRTGQIACWGMGLGATGTGNSGFTTAPVEVTGLSGVTAISAGRSHTCALRAGGQVACWGGIGYGTQGSRAANSAVDVAGVKDAVSLTSADYAACAADARRTLRCWGPLGAGATKYLDPTNVGRLPRGASTLHTLPGCVVAQGAVRCMGLTDRGRGKRSSPRLDSLGPVPGFAGATDVASGEFSFDCAVMADSGVVCRGTSWLYPSERGTVATGPTRLPGLSGVQSLSPGDVGSCAILLDRTATCWGEFDLGDGVKRSAPIPADGARLQGFTDIRALAATGPNGPCGVTGAGTVVCTRPPVSGASGRDASVPVGPYVMPGIGDAVDIVAGSLHACVLRAAGTVACWGSGSGGAIGDGPAPGGHGPQTRPATVDGVVGVTDL